MIIQGRLIKNLVAGFLPNPYDVRMETQTIGFILLVLGVFLMFAEAFSPAFGALGALGIISFVTGFVLVMKVFSPAFHLSWLMIVSMTIFAALVLALLVQFTLRVRKKRVVSGLSTLAGKHGVIEKEGEHAWVIVDGERWQVSSKDELVDKQPVTVLHAKGLTLIVKKCEEK